MSINNKVRDAYEGLLRHSVESPLLILHPGSKYRSLLLANLINDPEVSAYYYALGTNDDTLRGFIEGILHELPEQHATFGRHLNLLDQQVYENPAAHLEVLVDAFVNELGELSSSECLFILDEYDRSDGSDEIHCFIEKLAEKLPSHCHLVINGRMLPRLPWVSMVAKKQACLLLDHHLLVNNFYGNRRDDGIDLEVFALGESRVVHQSQEINKWEGHLPRLLFFFTLDKPTVTRSEICRAFWPELETEQAVNVFHVTKRRLHKAMKFDVLVHSENFYSVDPGLSVYYDVLDFVEALTRGRIQPNGASLEHWQHAIRLYRGAFLHGHSDAWIVDRRAAFQTGYLEALGQIAEGYKQQDRKDLALDTYRKGIEENVQQYDFHRAIMELYDEMGRRAEALAHYQNLTEQAASQKFTVPAELTDLYQGLAQ